MPRRGAGLLLAQLHAYRRCRAALARACGARGTVASRAAVGGARTDVELEERAAAAIKTVAHVDVVAGRARAERKQQQRQNRGGGPEPHSALLRLPLCGERRSAFCHVQPGRVLEFAARARDRLGERADVRPCGELIEEGWFGPGLAHRQFAERIGDVALLMHDDWSVKDWVRGDTRYLHCGNHGGTSADELRIPLVVAAC